MFTQLVIKEIKYQALNITFYLLIAVVLLFYATQFAPYMDTGMISGPEPGAATYGYKEVTDQETEIKSVYLNIYSCYNAGYILKQGILINKTVKHSEDQRMEMKAAMDKLAYFKSHTGETPFDNIEVKAAYDEYLKTIRSLDEYLGGSTYYSDKYRSNILRQPMTYEDAKQEYEDIKVKDKLTNAYGRVFADYMGVTAGLFPVFISAFVLPRDRRSRMQELIYSRSISSVKYLAAKYLGVLICLMTVYLAVAAHATYTAAAMAQQAGYAVDVLAFFKYTIAWIVPTLMYSTAMGMLMSLLFGNGGIAILVQFVLWLLSISTLSGSYELFRNVIRFNSLGAYESYISWLPQITANRIFYTLLSVVLVMAAAWIFSLKRGSAYGFKTFKANVVQHQDIA